MTTLHIIIAIAFIIAYPLIREGLTAILHDLLIGLAYLIKYIIIGIRTLIKWLGGITIA